MSRGPSATAELLVVVRCRMAMFTGGAEREFFS